MSSPPKLLVMDDREQRDTNPRPYSVGYGRPPSHTRFKQGQSGNPKGRRKGSLNLSTLIEKEMDQRVTVNENGAQKRITKKHAIAKQLVNKAASGDPKAIPLLMSEERLRETGTGSAPAEPSQIPEEDQLVMASLIERIRRSEPASETEAAQADPQSQPKSETNTELIEQEELKDLPS